MSVAVCRECGARSVLRSQFELEGECPECGEEALVEEDAYDESVLILRCVTCGREVDAAPIGAESGEEAGRYTVDDDCPVCGEGQLVPADQAPPVRARAEVKLARAAADKLAAAHTDASLPVNVQAVAAAVGLTVRRGPFEHDGLLRGAVIEVPDVGPAAERFVIAHEIGHHQLRHQVPEDKLEQEANAFASQLLMPPAALRRSVTEGLTLSALCRRFAVSKQAMVYALQDHRLINQVVAST